MTWAADCKPGQILKITKMVSDKGGELALGEDNVAWGIVLDNENMMVFTEVDQSGFYRGAPNASRWVSRVYPTDWADEDSVWADADEVPATVPSEFWPIAAQAALNDGV
jgi:hypothetical protein